MIFEQLENETDKAFAAFSDYLQLEQPRTLVAVARKHGCSNALMTKWSQRHNWINRAAAYDASKKDGRASAVSPQSGQQLYSSDSAPKLLPSPCNDATIQRTNDPLPFHPGPNESNKAFESFLCYFDLGVNRSFVQVSKQMDVTLGTVKMWARRYDWPGRIQAYNTHLLRVRINAVSATREQMAKIWAERTATFKEREWSATEKLLAAAQKVLDTFDQRDPSEISLAEVARALEIASKIGRLATGLATEKTEVTGENGGPIRIEFETALKKIYGETIDITPEQLEAPKIS